MREDGRENKAPGTSRGKPSHLRVSTAVKSLIAGAVAGLLVSAYRIIVQDGVDFAHSAYALAWQQPFVLLALAAAGVGAALLVHRLVTWEPMAGGSGIPQTEGAVKLSLKMRWWSVLVVRFAAGALGGIFGLSLGREGPSVQIGAAAGQMAFGRKADEKAASDERGALITAGSAAGLAAAFSAPLSGIVFALEEVQRGLSLPRLAYSAIASAAAGAVVFAVFGTNPVFLFCEIAPIDLAGCLWAIPLGLVAGLVGALVNKSLLLSQRLFGKLPGQVALSSSFLLALPVGMLVPQVMGGGSELVEFAEAGGGVLAVLLGLLAVKLVFTCTSFGSGMPGGIFIPNLAVGALAGAAFCALLAQGGLVPSDYMAAFAVCGMAGALTACVGTPLTGIVLALETCGQLSLALPVALSALVAYLVFRLLKIRPIYDVLLERYLSAHGDK